MKRRLTAILLTAALAFSLCGCGSVFDKEYWAVSDYVPPTQEKSDDTERITVRNFLSLKKSILDMVYMGATEGNIAFDPNYDGDALEDIEEACWQVRTQNALCAYCVVDITHETSKIVSYYETKIKISYAASAAPVSEIVQLPYVIGVEDILKNAMDNNQRRVVIFVNASSYSAARMANVVGEVYRTYPLCSAVEPKTDIYMYSGSALQRLYEINLDYGLSENELIRRKSQLKNLDVRNSVGATGMDDLYSAFAASAYLAEKCELSDQSLDNTVYSALIKNSANSEGLALAYVELCRQLGIECRIVCGQYAWKDHCWNIINIDGEYYHVDVSACIRSGMEYGFLRNDESMWTNYRWDTASYPSCTGNLTFYDINE